MTLPSKKECAAAALLLAALQLVACGVGTPIVECGEPAVKEWTIAIFMAADEGLAVSAEADLREMERVGSGADLNVLVQLETAASIRRFRIREGGRDACRAAANEKGAPGVRAFLAWGRDAFPARHQALILWGHSRGIAETLEAPPDDIKAADQDKRDKNKDKHVWLPRVADLAKALPPDTLDLLAFDSCFLSSIEASYQFRHLAKFMIASEGAIDKSGWDYTRVLKPLHDRPSQQASLTAIDVGTHIARHADTLRMHAELSLLDLQQSEPAVQAVTALVAALRQAALRNADDQRALSILLRQVESVRVRQFVDLPRLCLTVKDEFDATVRQRAEAAAGALSRFILVRGGHGLAREELGGVSIYYPHALAPSRAPGRRADDAILDGFIARPMYDQLDFARESHWADLLDVITPLHEGRQ